MKSSTNNITRNNRKVVLVKTGCAQISVTYVKTNIGVPEQAVAMKLINIVAISLYFTHSKFH